MVRSKRIQPISQIAGRAERKAALVLAKTKLQLQDLQDKLEMMKACRKDYERKQGETSVKVKVKDLQHKQTFLRQLDEAIDILEKQIHQQAKLTVQEQKKWVETWKYMNSLNKAIDNLKSGEKQKTEQREQAQLDEHAINIKNGV